MIEVNFLRPSDACTQDLGNLQHVWLPHECCQHHKSCPACRPATYDLRQCQPHHPPLQEACLAWCKGWKSKTPASLPSLLPAWEGVPEGP